MERTAPSLIHHGAREGVTGSCHQLTFSCGNALLVDIGLFQGDENPPARTSDASNDSVQLIEFECMPCMPHHKTQIHRHTNACRACRTTKPKFNTIRMHAVHAAPQNPNSIPFGCMPCMPHHKTQIQYHSNACRSDIV